MVETFSWQEKEFMSAVIQSHDVIPIKDLNNDKGFPTTPFSLATNRKSPIKYFRTFGCPWI